jgi:hypothetical protein
MAGLAACGASETGSTLSESAITEDPGRGALVADGLAQFPDEGLVNWVSFSDGVVALTVVSEHREEIPADLLERKEGYVGRTIDVRIDLVLWSPEFRTAQLAAEDTLEMLVFGWVLDDTRLVAMANVNSPRLEVDGQYIMPLVEFERGWAPMTSQSPLSAPDSVVADADVAAWQAVSPARGELAVQSFSDMATVLAHVAPDPVAARYFHLRPEERLMAVTMANER